MVGKSWREPESPPGREEPLGDPKTPLGTGRSRWVELGALGAGAGEGTGNGAPGQQSQRESLGSSRRILQGGSSRGDPQIPPGRGFLKRESMAFSSQRIPLGRILGLPSQGIPPWRILGFPTQGVPPGLQGMGLAEGRVRMWGGRPKAFAAATVPISLRKPAWLPSGTIPDSLNKPFPILSRIIPDSLGNRS